MDGRHQGSASAPVAGPRRYVRSTKGEKADVNKWQIWVDPCRWARSRERPGSALRSRWLTTRRMGENAPKQSLGAGYRNGEKYPEADDMASAFRAAANLAITVCCTEPRTRQPDKSRASDRLGLDAQEKICRAP